MTITDLIKTWKTIGYALNHREKSTIRLFLKIHMRFQTTRDRRLWNKNIIYVLCQYCYYNRSTKLKSFEMNFQKWNKKRHVNICLKIFMLLLEWPQYYEYFHIFNLFKTKKQKNNRRNQINILMVIRFGNPALFGQETLYSVIHVSLNE